METLRDGHSFSSRRVNVTQSQGSILTAIASFQTKGQEGMEYADPMPTDVPDPESLKSSKELMEPFADKSSFAKYYAYNSPFDIRYISQPILLGPLAPTSAATRRTVANSLCGCAPTAPATSRRRCTAPCSRSAVTRSCWSRSCAARG